MFETFEVAHTSVSIQVAYTSIFYQSRKLQFMLYESSKGVKSSIYVHSVQQKSIRPRVI